MINKIILLVLITFFLGCGHVYLPLKTQLRQLEDYPKNGCNDCVVQAWRGHTLLMRNHELSRIACGDVGIIWKHKHCWNEVYCSEDNKWHLIDLTERRNLIDLTAPTVRDGWPVSQYFEYNAEAYWYGKPDIVEIKLNVNPTVRVN